MISVKICGAVLLSLVAFAVATIAVFGFKTSVPYPFGAERTGYPLSGLKAPLTKAESAGVSVLVAPHTADSGRSAMQHFFAGYSADVHSGSRS